MYGCTHSPTPPTAACTFLAMQCKLLKPHFSMSAWNKTWRAFFRKRSPYMKNFSFENIYGINIHNTLGKYYIIFCSLKYTIFHYKNIIPLHQESPEVHGSLGLLILLSPQHILLDLEILEDQVVLQDFFFLRYVQHICNLLYHLQIYISLCLCLCVHSIKTFTLSHGF